MKSFLIAYRLNNPEIDYPKIRDHIKSYPKWAKLFSQTWLIKTDDKVSDVRSAISSAIDGKGKILVINVSSATWATYSIDKDVTTWMKDNL